MLQIYRYELTVPKEAEDQNGHVNNIEYLRWMQDAAVQHSGTSGCTEATNAIGATWVALWWIFFHAALFSRRFIGPTQLRRTRE